MEDNHLPPELRPVNTSGGKVTVSMYLPLLLEIFVTRTFFERALLQVCELKRGRENFLSPVVKDVYVLYTDKLDKSGCEEVCRLNFLE